MSMRFAIYIYGNHVGFAELHNGLWAFDIEALKALTRLGKLVELVETLDRWPPSSLYSFFDMIELQRI